MSDEKKAYMLTDREAYILYAGLLAKHYAEVQVPWKESPRLRAIQEQHRRETFYTLQEFISQCLRLRSR